MLTDYTTSFIIFYNNLSTYYLICLLMSIIAIFLTWLYHFKSFSGSNNEKKNSKESLQGPDSENELKDILQNLKEVKKQTLEKYAASLTEDQLEEEKKIEQQQLAAILKLLQEQEDKFQVSSMEELEGQLKLYR